MQAPQPVSIISVRRAAHPCTVLVVDDEEIVLDIAGAILRESGYTVLTAGSGEAAIEIARAKGAEISLAIIDPGLPGLNGPGTFAALLALQPGLALVVSSGSLPGRALDAFDIARVSDFVPKPYTASRLRKAVDSALRPALAA
jgi:two-component system, cell cycle sensor histidine kinase and response regulator CckA